MVTETALRFGRASHLVGVLSDGHSSMRTAVLFINAGLVHRSGPHRLHVRLARQLAESGVHCFRFDLSGIGDSTHSGGSDEDAEVSDISDAINLLRDQGIADRFVLFGICAGAVRAYNAALADARVTGLFLIDGYLYETWKTPVVHLFSRLRQEFPFVSLLGRKFRKLMRKTEPPVARGFVYETGMMPIDAYASGLGKLAARGTWVRHVMTGSFPEKYNYSRQFVDAFPAFATGQHVTATYLRNTDHTFSRYADQERLANLIHEHVCN